MGPSAGWIGWACLLYGLAAAGMQCNGTAGSPFLEAAFRRGTRVLLTVPLQAGQENSVSNLIYAAGLAKADPGVLSPLVAHVADAAQQGRALTESTEQTWSTILLGLAKMSCYNQSLIETAAKGIAQLPASSQAVANSLWSLSELGWYDPCIYDRLLGHLAKDTQVESQHISSSLLACAAVHHTGPGLQQLLATALNSSISSWKEQQCSNALYAWVTACADTPAAATHGVWAAYDQLAGLLAVQARTLGTARLSQFGARQLWATHVMASKRGLDPARFPEHATVFAMARDTNRIKIERVQAAVARDPLVRQLATVCKHVSSGGQTSISEADPWGLWVVDLVVRGQGFTRGIAIIQFDQPGWLRQPVQALSGTAIAAAAMLRQSYDAVIITPKIKTGTAHYHAHVTQLVSSTVQALQQQASQGAAAIGANEQGLVVNGWWEGSEAAWAAELAGADEAAAAPASAPATNPSTTLTNAPAAAAAPARQATAATAAVPPVPLSTPASPKPALNRPALPRAPNGLLWK